MILLGTFVNTLAIVAGSLIGLLFRGRISASYHRTVMQAIGLSVVVIGISGALKFSQILLIIFSLALGSLLGQLIGIETRLTRFGDWVQHRFASGESDVTKGFVTTSLLYCVGSMAIVGSLESGISGNHQTLYAKSILDGIASVLFASSLGWGVLLSAAPVLLYQGAIVVSASTIAPFLTPAVVSDMSSVGGILILAIGIELLDLKRLHVGNMLPAVFIPLAYGVLYSLFK
uniref:DUF554 domain-containing protein n=1 Tax=Desulfatirhabdium butyrativorans TaxID=340467 RepID=A0A7C4RPQ2_9BACT